MMGQVTHQRLTGQLVPEKRATTNIVRSTTPKVRSAFKAREKGKKIYHRLPNKYGVKLSALPKRNTQRPLNSFFAFRAYYAKIFKGLQQKENSPFLSKLWEHDPFKAKWAILAKAYSIIRDEKDIRDRELLQKFLKVNTGFVEMVTPEVYLETLGWTFVVDAEGRTTLYQKLNCNTGRFDQHMLTTNKSVEDVLENSYTNGLGKANAGKANAGEAEQGPLESITMATSSQLPSTDEPFVGPQDQHLNISWPSLDELDQYVGLYPHNLAFDPLSLEGYYYDPFAGDEFDAFHVSGMEDLSGEDWYKTSF
ncbi:MAG: hypothetical protein Q9191_008486 [Dirinaria sp. TL-2023a]